MSGETGSRGHSEENAVGLSIRAERPGAWSAREADVEGAWSAREAGMETQQKQHAK